MNRKQLLTMRDNYMDLLGEAMMTKRISFDAFGAGGLLSDLADENGAVDAVEVERSIKGGHITMPEGSGPLEGVNVEIDGVRFHAGVLELRAAGFAEENVDYRITFPRAGS